jgi:8-oxo-dGTP pyrophosphatase MutT (NUDIX family)
VSEPVPIRDGATVVIARTGASGREVLLLRRGASVFVPGAHCFPGGQVDPGDGDPTLAERCDDREAPELAFRIAALRETFEESGLLLADRPVDPGRLTELRAELEAGDRTFADVLDALGCRLGVRALQPLGRWVTPPGGPRRYDARFFLAEAPDGQEATPDGTEMLSCDWYRPVDALAAADAGEIQLILPTRRTLELVDDMREVSA